MSFASSIERRLSALLRHMIRIIILLFYVAIVDKLINKNYDEVVNTLFYRDSSLWRDFAMPRKTRLPCSHPFKQKFNIFPIYLFFFASFPVAERWRWPGDHSDQCPITGFGGCDRSVNQSGRCVGNRCTNGRNQSGSPIASIKQCGSRAVDAVSVNVLRKWTSHHDGSGVRPNGVLVSI